MEVGTRKGDGKATGAQDSDSDSGEELVPVRRVKRLLRRGKETKTEERKVAAVDDYDPNSLEDYWLRTDEIERRNARRHRTKAKSDILTPLSSKETALKSQEDAAETLPTEAVKESQAVLKSQSVREISLLCSGEVSPTSADNVASPNSERSLSPGGEFADVVKTGPGFLPLGQAQAKEVRVATAQFMATATRTPVQDFLQKHRRGKRGKRTHRKRPMMLSINTPAGRRSLPASTVASCADR